ncbi:MAG TPA: response regulator [Oscillatoriaceae cyanobacterium M33_DOE_052]|uniref:histidine kinase n=1 Tax=Planktothricoides sp. SpSt-374 TaxID=2282167 RepID=A0A7C3VN45_9CYAN|nr:response regulator [Oscillatoriaceae cyanobacterium M33_DOE_052]
MKKILVIEDDAVLASNISAILEEEGFEAVTASNGMAGVKLTRAVNPDLILCDLAMPEVDGYGVLEVLKSNEKTALIPVIIVSGNSDRVQVRKSIEMGADDYITKPFELDELLRAVVAIFQKQELREQRLVAMTAEMNKLRNVVAAKDNLVTNLNQSLRQPLSNIQMALKLLRENSDQEGRDRYLKIIQEEFDRELNLINQVSQLQNFLTPDNVTLMYQFQIISHQPRQPDLATVPN